MAIIKTIIYIIIIIISMIFLASGIKSELKSYEKDIFILKDVFTGLNFFNRYGKKNSANEDDPIDEDNIEDNKNDTINERKLMEQELIEKYHQDKKAIESLNDKELNEIYKFWTE